MERAELERELERLHRESYGWALSCCGRDRGSDVAGDVLQAAYVQVLSGAARFAGRSTFRTWLFGVIRRTALAERRRSLRWTGGGSPEAALAGLSDPSPGPEQNLEETARREELLAALATLSERQREVVTLVFYHELTIEEAAGVMEISTGSARTHYARAKALLLARLTQRAIQ